MIDQKILTHLESSGEFKLLSDYQEKYRQLFEENGIGKDTAIYTLMTTYAGEFSGSEGTIGNIGDELSDWENSVTYSLIQNEGIPDYYISLFSYEFDDYLLYNKQTDEVVFVEGANLADLKSGNYTKKWKSSNEFLLDFFQLN